jgi:hypothetical protein
LLKTGHLRALVTQGLVQDPLPAVVVHWPDWRKLGLGMILAEGLERRGVTARTGGVVVVVVVGGTVVVVVGVGVVLPLAVLVVDVVVVVVVGGTVVVVGGGVDKDDLVVPLEVVTVLTWEDGVFTWVDDWALATACEAFAALRRDTSSTRTFPAVEDGVLVD